MVTMVTTLYTRDRHGNLPVRVLDRGRRFKLLTGNGNHKEFDSMRALLRDLHEGRESGYSYERYFKVGRFKQGPVGEEEVEHSILEMFGAEKGIDVSEKAEDIARIFYRYFGASANRYGYSVPDLLQDVYRGILVRNNGKCPFDPEKASFGHYVYMVCTCVFRNYHKREQRRRGRETLGCRQVRDSAVVVDDAAEKAECLPGEQHDHYMMELKEVHDDLLEWMEDQPDAADNTPTLARRILPLVLQGMRRSEIAEVVSKPKHTVGYALAYLRSVAGEWREIVLEGRYTTQCQAR